MSDFVKGPVHKLPPDVCRYEVVYKLQVDDGDWKVHRMFATKKIGQQDRIAAELRNRLMRHPHPFEIIMVRPIGDEVPLQTGSASAVVTPEEYASQQNAARHTVEDRDIEERAKEIGLWFPGIGKMDA